MPWLATMLTHDPLLISLVAGARTLPWFTCSLPAGVITDRFDHRRILYAADAAHIALALALLTLALTAHPGSAPVVALALVQNSFGGMIWNIAQVSDRQRDIPAPLLGRVNSAFRFIGTDPAAFGVVMFGALITWAEPAGPIRSVLLPYAVAAGIAAALTLYATLRLRLNA